MKYGDYEYELALDSKGRLTLFVNGKDLITFSKSGNVLVTRPDIWESIGKIETWYHDTQIQDAYVTYSGD